ncbi:MAG: hypothetical protein HOP20_06210 [Sulfuriferula sp.]|nr:hypothetical protein [Sulfuriferula sp.]
MTYTDLINALQTRTGYPLLSSTNDVFLTSVTQMIYDWCALNNPHATVTRAAVVNSLGPLRRDFMAGNGTAADFHKLNQIIETIDAIFDDDYVRNQQA